MASAWSGRPLLLALTCAACATTAPAIPKSPWVGKALPAIQRRALDGSQVDTEAAARPVVVKFFARYCEPCRRTLPQFESLHKKHRDVLFVGVDLDEHESEARALIAEYALTMPVVADRANAIAGRFRVVDLPVTFVADEQKVVRAALGPEQTEENVEAALRAVAR